MGDVRLSRNTPHSECRDLRSSHLSAAGLVDSLAQGFCKVRSVFPRSDGHPDCRICGAVRHVSGDSESVLHMTRDHQHNPDPNENAYRIVGEATRDDTALPADLEAAWVGH